MAQRYSKPDIAEAYKAHFRDDVPAVRHLINWMDSESMRLLQKAKGVGMEEAYGYVNEANGILKVKEHIQTLSKIANPNE